MSDLKPSTTFKVIESSDNFVDVNAEVAAITAYGSVSGNVLNICFMRNFVISMTDESGEPSSSEVVLRKVASINMSIPRAKALYVALGAALDTVPSGDEK